LPVVLRFSSSLSFLSQLLIATGGSPKALPVMKKLAPEAAQHVTTYRRVFYFLSPSHSLVLTIPLLSVSSLISRISTH